ncbi:hypothetical protein [Halarchaeum sp. P4]|uniref:hypothetical protein n=1 Tax=Halarchaeum sp. P4 TaxID=3421639 RepID=UPI003EB89547
MTLRFPDRTGLYRALVLWFVAATFIQTGSGGSHPLLLAASFVALVLLWVIPLLLVVGVAGELYAHTVDGRA